MKPPPYNEKEVNQKPYQEHIIQNMPPYPHIIVNTQNTNVPQQQSIIINVKRKVNHMFYCLMTFITGGLCSICWCGACCGCCPTCD